MQKNKPTIIRWGVLAPWAGNTPAKTNAEKQTCLNYRLIPSFGIMVISYSPKGTPLRGKF
jgi:hypothetical protein